MESELTLRPERARVPVSHRIAPATSFGLTALGGILGAWWTIQLFQQLKKDNSATIKILMDSIGSIAQSVGLIYCVAAFIGIVSIVVSLMRPDDDEASLPGVAYLAGMPALVSPLLSAYAMNIVIGAFHTTEKLDFTKLGGDVANAAVISIIAGAGALLFLMCFTFLPFTAKVGKRFSPVIGIGLVLAGIIAVAALSFWLVAFSQMPTNPEFGA